MTLEALLWAPFAEFAFMRRALAATLALGLGCGPIGALLVLRRMSLMGDALAHALLPGAALGFLVAGFSLPAMGLGSFLVALLVALAAGWVSRVTVLREDASFAAFYLISLALGVLLMSTHGSGVDLLHVLFGSVLAVDEGALLLSASVASITLLTLALIYRPLVVECFDPGFLHAVGGRGALVHAIFLVLTVANLVSGFQALGTLMAVGLMMLPAAAARFWAGEVWSVALLAAALAVFSGVVGLIWSFHAQLPSGPAIVLVAGAVYLVSLVAGPQGGWRSRRGMADGAMR